MDLHKSDVNSPAPAPDARDIIGNMTIEETNRPKEPSRREDFPIESFRYLEGRLQYFRRKIMEVAANIAASRDPQSHVYVVTKEDIDDAIRRDIGNTESCLAALGYNQK